MTSRGHGLWNHPLYETWKSMLRRCESPAHPRYPSYGGRGIRVCDRWHDVQVFVADVERWLGPRPAGMTLDRICNDHDYRLDNVRWATWSEQNRNQRPKRHRNGSACEVDSCEKSPTSLGMCATHYKRHYRQLQREKAH